MQKINTAIKSNIQPVRRIDSSDNIRIYNLNEYNEFKNKSESPEHFRNNNCYLPNFNYINNIHNLNNNINNGNMIYNNDVNHNYYNQNNINNLNNLNLFNNNNNMNNKFHNINNNNVNNINFLSNFNSPHNSNNNLNMSFNFSRNKINNINDSMEDIFKKREDSFNSCPSLRGNHLSFNTTTDTNNNANFINNSLFNSNNNIFLKKNENQNLLSMQKLFLNLNPYTASLMRNNDANMNYILNNYSSNFKNNNTNFFNNANNNHLNNFKSMTAYNLNGPINQQPKKSHSTKGFHNLIGNFGFNPIYNYTNLNINNNNSIDGNMSNDNLSHSSMGSNKAQIKKKRTSLFQNGCNKEKDLRDFKRFCDGLKIPMPDYICTQIGSRIMQKYLKRFPSYIRTLLIEKISKYFEKLMCDIYGNYFCQKLYNISELEQRILILNSLKDSFIKISKNNYGAHVTQFIIGEAQSDDEKKIIINYISNHELELSFDPEGTHVLQKIISCFPENERQNLNDILCIPDNLNALCQDTKGMCVIKKLISNTENISNKNKIIDGVSKHCIEIAQNPFGNYIIQYIFDELDDNLCSNLIKLCINNSLIFATQKYSSNIIVKIIDLYFNINNLNFKFVQQLKEIFFDSNNIFELYNNKYGRLLLSKLSKLMTKEEKEKKIKLLGENNDDTKKKEKTNILTELFC